MYILNRHITSRVLVLDVYIFNVDTEVQYFIMMLPDQFTTSTETILSELDGYTTPYYYHDFGSTYCNMQLRITLSLHTF